MASLHDRRGAKPHRLTTRRRHPSSLTTDAPAPQQRKPSVTNRRSRPTTRFGLGADGLGQPQYQKTYPWSQLNNRRITLSFKPATAADEQALASLLPEGEITDISQLPSSIPAYLIRVIPELKLAGETVLTGDPMKLGEEVAFSYTIQDPALGIQHYPNWVIAGSYLGVGVVGGAVATGSLEQLQQKLEATKAKLESQNEAQIASLTREDLLGDMFHAGLLGYFAQYQALGHLAALSQQSHVQLATSAGTYGYVPNVTYFFGLPRSISPGGVEMDMDRVAIATSVDTNNREAWKGFNFQLGALSSALEHAIPEQMFVTEENPGEAVSAVKALQKAASQGQRIYHITQANQAQALPNIRQNALAMSEISQALAAGREVIAHTDPISVPGWTGAGYVIFDPDTGAGAWKIGGGANGSWLYALLGAFFSAVLDGMLDKYRPPTAMFGPDRERAFSRVVNFVAKALTLLAFAYATYSTVVSPQLTTPQHTPALRCRDPRQQRLQ